MRRWPGGHVAIDGDLGQVGTEHVGAGLEQDRRQGDDRVQLVWPEIGEESAH